MKASEFCYWLQGLFELGDAKVLDERQTDLVRRHLALVFRHDIDPSYSGPAEQAALNEIHNPPAEHIAPKPPRPGYGGHGPGGMVYRC